MRVESPPPDLRFVTARKSYSVLGAIPDDSVHRELGKCPCDEALMHTLTTRPYGAYDERRRQS